MLSFFIGAIDRSTFIEGGINLNVLYSGLRTGFTPSAKVFGFRHPNEVISYVLLNLLATTVISPRDIEELIIIKNTDVQLDVEYIKNAVELDHNVRIVTENNKSIFEYMTSSNNANTLLAVINKSENASISDDQLFRLQNEMSFEEKVGIEISSGNKQRFWFDDYSIDGKQDVFHPNAVVALLFVGNYYTGGANNSLFDLTLHPEIDKKNHHLNELIKNLKVDFEWVLEADYLEYQNFRMLEAAVSELNIHTKFEKPNSIEYGNSPNLNGIRGLLSIYHKLAHSERTNGLVFVEDTKSWRIIQLKKRSKAHGSSESY